MQDCQESSTPSEEKSTETPIDETTTSGKPTTPSEEKSTEILKPKSSQKLFLKETVEVPYFLYEQFNTLKEIIG